MQTPTSSSYHTVEISEKPLRDAAYSRWREQVGKQLFKHGMLKESQLWNDCSDPALFFSPDLTGQLPAGVVGVNCCSDDPKHQANAVCPSCQLRFCPDCCHRQTARLLERFMPVLRGLVADSDDEMRMRHIVLTTPIDLRDANCREKLLELCKAVTSCFDELLHATWREDCGLLFAFEFGEGGQKLHFHCLFFGPYIDQKKLVNAWRKVTNSLCEVAFIRLVTEDVEKGQSLESAVAEVLKYTTKLWKRLNDGSIAYLEPSLVPLLAKVLKGTRRIRSYGLLFGFEVEEVAHTCEICAAPVIRLAPLEWEIFCNTGFLPPEWRQVRAGAHDLSTYIGNNFLEGGGDTYPQKVFEQPNLPTFDTSEAEKVRRQFDL